MTKRWKNRKVLIITPKLVAFFKKSHRRTLWKYHNLLTWTICNPFKKTSEGQKIPVVFGILHYTGKEDCVLQGTKKIIIYLFFIPIIIYLKEKK